MNSVYIRMVLYFIAPLVAMVPGITYNPADATVLIELNSVAVSLAGSAIFSAAVFKTWGVK